MANLSQLKRLKMLDFLNTLKDEHKDDNQALKAIYEIENEITSKKYGLVWEEHEENVDKQIETHIPAFTEVKDKEIIGDENNQNFNFLLEGDNLHSLKLLEKTHKGKIDVIYIDPPYNLGGDFIYNDEYLDKEDEFKHSKWLSFMHHRLAIARTLLKDGGMIFISIDDAELFNLKLLCDEIFGELSFVNHISVKTSEATGVKMAHVNKRLPKYKESILFYRKGEIRIEDVRIKKEEWDNEYKILVEGVTKKELELVKKIMDLENPNINDLNVGNKICAKMRFVNYNKLFDENMNEEEISKVKYDNAYRILRDVATSGGAKKIADENKKYFREGAFLIMTPRKKVYLIKSDYNEKAKQPRMKMLFADQYLTSNVGDFWNDIKTTGLAAEGGIDFLNGKKPLKLIERILEINGNNDATILDFFAGSGTTAQAVMQLNEEDKGNRKYILCTNNENNICEEITYQRILNIQNGLPHNLKYYKTDFIPKTEENKDTALSDELLQHIKEMVQLEHGIDIDNKNYHIILTDEEADEMEKEWENHKECKGLYISKNVLLTTKQNSLFSSVEINTIPDYYFESELREVGEIW